MAVFVVQFHGLTEVQDRQQREDEGLDQADEEVERLPDGVGCPLEVPGANNAISATRMPPAKMLPKSRSANEIGLAISSTMLIGMRNVT